MSATKTCGKCGAEMLAETAGGLCPRCLMALNFDSRTMPEDEAPQKAVPLSPEEMRAHFPQFEVLECLGRGGMGVVYKARQKTLDRLVAIKVLAGEWQGEAGFAARFEKEAKTLAQMSHPNIVTVHDFGETSGLFYIVMEYVDGVNLRDLLRDGKLESEQALAIVPPICEALQYAHAKSIVHRDIKPENLLLDRDGRIKIADFGIAKLIGPVASVCDRRTSEDENQRRSQTAATLNAGTLGYSAPEQISDPQHIDQRADIYSLGVVLYEMLTGERPNKDLVAPSKRVHIDVRLDEIVLRALEKTPELRYQTAGEFRTQVETMVETIEATPPESKRRESGPHDSTAEKPFGELPAFMPALYTASWLTLCGTICSILLAALANGTGVWVLCGIFTSAMFAVLAVVYTQRLADPALRRKLLITHRGYEYVAAILIVSLGFIATVAIVSSKRRYIDPDSWWWFSLVAMGLAVFAVWILKQSRSAVKLAESAPAHLGATPRFSRTAILGACWAAASALHFLIPTLGYRMKSEFVPIMMSILGLSAPFGATILGWIAVWQIRRSAGRLHGLWLAVLDGLLFPLLALTGLIGWFWSWAFYLMQAYLIAGEPQLSPLKRLLVTNINGLTILATLLTSLIVDFLIIRRFWRKLSKPLAGPHHSEQPKPTSGGTPASETKPTPLGKWAIGFFIGAVVGFPLLWGFMGAQEVIVLCGLALLLSLVMGLMSWRSHSGKFAALAAGLGLLVCVAFTFNYLTPRPPRGPYEGAGSSTMEKATMPSLSFGPVIERELRVDEQTLFQGLDFESGKVLTLSLEEFNRTDDDTGGRLYGNVYDWPKAKGMDMFAVAGEKGFGVAGLVKEFKLGALPVATWDTATKSDIEEALEHAAMEGDKFVNGLKIPTNAAVPLTYAMKSGNKLGLLQITARVQNPDGIKLRYKLLQRDVIDQIVPSIYGRELGDLKCFDFEANRFHSPPKALADELLTAVNREQARKEVWHRVNPELLEWLEKTGVDVVAASYDSGAGLLFIDQSDAGEMALPLKGSLGEIDPSQAPLKLVDGRLPKNVMNLTRTAFLGWPREPRNEFFPFQTREGNRGVLQVTGITDDPYRGVKIRYKLVQTASHSDPIADPAASDTSAVDGSWGDHFKNGEIRRAQNKLEDSLASYRLSLAVVQAEMKRRPHDAALQTVGQRRNKQSLTRIGDVLCTQGDLVGALENYRAAKASFEPLVRREPADEEQRNELVALYVKIGDVLDASGDKAGALAAFRKAQEVDFPDFQTWEETFKSIGGDYNPTTAFKPDELRQLATNPKSHGDFRRLMWLINRAGAEKDAGFRYLLDKPELRKNEEVNLALIGYAYSINGNPKALDELLAKLAKEKVGSDSSVVVALSFVDEWDRVPKVVKAHFSETDGAGGTSQASYKLRSAYYFPRNSLRHEGKAGEGAPVNIHAKIVQGDHDKSAPTTDASLPPGFGPVVERLVPRLGPGKACLLDFETGEFQTPPDDLAEKMKRNTTEKAELTKASLRWLQESRVDIASSPHVDTIYFLGAIASKYQGNNDRPLGFDDFTPAIVVDVLSGPLIEPERKPGIYSSVIPANLGGVVFITSEGNTGVLEILGGADDPAGVKIRYKLLQGVKPSAEAMAAAKVVMDLPPIEPVKELKIPQQDFPDGGGREGYRLTVEPSEGDYILATLREYEGSEVVGEKTPVKRQVERLLRTQSVSHSEDIFLDSHRVARPSRSDEAVPTAATDHFAVSGFGQQVAITGLDFSGGSGGSAQSGDKQQSRSAKRRFKFADSNGDKTRTRIVEFELRVIRADEAAALAKRHGISLPDENVANWAITLSAPPQTKEGEKAEN